MDTNVYLVFDPTDLLSQAASSHHSMVYRAKSFLCVGLRAAGIQCSFTRTNGGATRCPKLHWGRLIVEKSQMHSNAQMAKHGCEASRLYASTDRSRKGGSTRSTMASSTRCWAGADSASMFSLIDSLLRVLVMLRRGAAGLALLLTVMVPALSAQQTESRLARLRQLKLPELSGSVPTIYALGAKHRAIAYQQSLEAAHTWFEQQLGVKVPIILAVVDAETYSKLQDFAWPLPYSDPDPLNPNLIVFPSRIEDLIGPESRSKTAGEYINYHEDGHEFAYALGIYSGNNFVNELVANIFMAAYIDAERQDLGFVLKGPPTSERPRYTSLEDLDYVYANGVGFKNYVWFQWQLQRIADFLVTGQSFSGVIGKLQTEFPSAQPKQETLDQIISRLDRIRPGVRAVLGSLAGPTTLPPILPAPCTKAAVRDPRTSVVAVRNETGALLTLILPDGHRKTIGIGGWDSFELKSGESLKLIDGTCICATGDTALAVVPKEQ